MLLLLLLGLVYCTWHMVSAQWRTEGLQRPGANAGISTPPVPLPHAT